jgi:hypothetical protein
VRLRPEIPRNFLRGDSILFSFYPPIRGIDTKLRKVLIFLDYNLSLKIYEDSSDKVELSLEERMDDDGSCAFE